MKRPIALWRSLFILMGLAVGAAVIYWGAPLTAGSTVVLRLLLTILATLAGFIIAIITVSGNPRFLHPGNWRQVDAQRNEIMRPLHRYLVLFYSYMATIVFALAATVADGMPDADLWAHWLERITLGVGASAIFWSFALPTSLVRAQNQKLRHQVDRQRGVDREQRRELLAEQPHSVNPPLEPPSERNSR